jgi:hypothetical protein
MRAAWTTTLPAMSDRETIASELRLMGPVRRMVRDAEGRTSSTARIDALLDERSQCARATLSNMAFNVIRGPEPPLIFGDNERFEIVDGGVLKIYRADGTNFYINPSTWVSIEEMPPPGTGARVHGWPDKDDA